MYWEFDRVTNSTARNEPPNTRVQPILVRCAAQWVLCAVRLAFLKYS